MLGVFENRVLNVLYNQLLTPLEAPWHYRRDPKSLQLRRRNVANFRHSMTTQSHCLTESGCDTTDAILASFADFARGAGREYMLLGIGDEGSDIIESIAIESGAVDSVGWPKAGVRELRHRVRCQRRCRMICVHNHPHNLLHELLRLMEMGPPGASDRDRDLAVRFMLGSLRSKMIVPEFYLFEQDQFRRILAPSWQSLVELFKRCR